MIEFAIGFAMGAATVLGGAIYLGYRLLGRTGLFVREVMRNVK